MVHKLEIKKGGILVFTKRAVFLFLFSLFFTKGQAQLGNSFDIGVTLGVTSVQSDYGERGDIRSGVIGNIGFASSLILYKNFYDKNVNWNSRANWLEDHIKLKAEVSYYKANLHHFGTYSEGSSHSANLLRAMHGTSSVINFGGLVEHHFFSLTNYNSYATDRFFSPYFSFGGMLGISKASVSSDFGDYTTDPSLLISAYQNNAIYTEQLTVGSVVFGLGTRIKIGEYSDLVFDTRWQSYFSDRIDGLKPRIDANKHLDWTYSMSLGLVIAL